MDVVETINYYFATYRHGIFRYIPFTVYKDNKRYDMEYTFHSVTDENGNKYNYTKSTSNEKWILKIGDPNHTITGSHTYVLSYSVKGALGYFADHDELYWNVTGNGWEHPIFRSRATITFPEKMEDTKVQLRCFTGNYGSNTDNCIWFSSKGTNTIAYETTRTLENSEGFTIAAAFPKGTTAVLLPTKYVPFFETPFGKIVGLLIVAALILWYIASPFALFFVWWKYGRDPYVGQDATASYDPPKLGRRFLTPAETGALLDEKVDNRDIFSTIVDLARRGYIKIEEPKKKDFYLRYTDKPKKKETLQPFETKLLLSLFVSSEYIHLKDEELYETIAAVEKMLYADLIENGYFAKNPKTIRSLYYVLGGFALFTLNFLLAFSAFFFGRIMPHKTLEGAKAAQQARGLKNFLTSQKRQLEFQADKQMMFEKLLPYAVAFGVEEIWAKRFEAFNLKPPSWYSGYDNSSFNSLIFVSSLNHSYSSFSTASTPPSSGGSGFGGGGFSGGGGGGGGGGSW